jgi:hypothetical protein
MGQSSGPSERRHEAKFRTEKQLLPYWLLPLGNWIIDGNFIVFLFVFCLFCLFWLRTVIVFFQSVQEVLLGWMLTDSLLLLSQEQGQRITGKKNTQFCVYYMERGQNFLLSPYSKCSSWPRVDRGRCVEISTFFSRIKKKEENVQYCTTKSCGRWRGEKLWTNEQDPRRNQ